jgi:hypothetical protein
MTGIESEFENRIKEFFKEIRKPVLDLQKPGGIKKRK